MEESNSVAFTEDMRGHFSLPQPSEDIFRPLDKKEFLKASEAGQGENQEVSFHLTIEIDDIDKFCKKPDHKARAVGYVDIPKLGGKLRVTTGIFNLFTLDKVSNNFNTAREMHYLLYFRSSEGVPYTFFGYKDIEREDYTDLWQETTTLYTYIWEGHHEFGKEDTVLFGAGVLTLNLKDFIKQMGTFETSGGDFTSRATSLLKFMGLFTGSLWEAYAPTIFGTDSSRWNHHIFPVNTLQGVKDCTKTLIPIDTDDGLTLTMARFKKRETKDVVLLIHGLTTSTDMFIMPEHGNLTQYLLDNGYEDVWSLDWRGSKRFTYNLTPNRYNVDDIAFYDMPRAVFEIRKEVGADVRIHVICHCVGSIAFMAALSAGWVKGIQSIISNSVSLTPNIGLIAKIKMTFAPFIIEYIFGYPYLSPKIPYFPGPGFGKWIYWMERLLRRECKEPACHMVSFMWGWGFPAAYLHRNLSPITHRRLMDLFGGTGVHYYRHLRKMTFKKETIPYDIKKSSFEIPESYIEGFGNEETPAILFISGDKNLIFPNSNKMTYEKLKELYPQKNISYQEFKEYGHQDIFMGKFCDKEVFPSLVEFINKNKGL